MREPARARGWVRGRESRHDTEHPVELRDSDDDDPTNRFAASIRGARREGHVVVDDERLLAAAAVRIKGHWIAWPTDSEADPDDPDDPESTLCALAIPMLDEQFVVLTARGPEATPPPDAPLESLERFAAQAGASLHNAQVHRGLEELKDRLDHEASHDALTGLANRRCFIEEFDRAAPRTHASGLVGLLFVDLDGFKDVNDRYGHHAGNELLVGVAVRLRECVRPGDLVARLGGDEFTIFLARLETAAPAVAIADPPGRRGDVSRQSARQGAVDDGPRIAASGGRSEAPGPKKPLKLGLISPIPRGERVTMHFYFPTSHGGNVNRSQLLNELAERNGVTRREADTFLTSFTDLITATVSTGEDVAISGFAKFRRIDRPARMARNPATGEQVKVAAKRVARITPLKAFKDSVLSGKKAPAKKAPAKKATKTAAKKAPAKRAAVKKAPAKKKAAAKRR